MNIIELFDIKTKLLAKDKVILEMPITDEVKQPFGLVHGGVNALLAETAASMAANENVHPNQVAVGVDVHAHHLYAVSVGRLVATATPVKIGSRIQVWEVDVREAIKNRLSSFVTVTVMINDKEV